MSRDSFAPLWIRTLTKSDLHSLIADAKAGASNAISRAVSFVAAESYGLWHNRARAKLCRHFKNHPPPDSDCNQMVDSIVDRLLDGRFYEQFKDQLSMAIRFAPERLGNAATVASDSERDYIRRYAVWVQNALASAQRPPNAR